MTNIFFTSDTHFYHRNILEYCNRPFSTVDEMNEALIANWNQTVGANDIVYHLGDFTLTTRVDLVDGILARLNGKIILVKGNHDKWLRKFDQLQNQSKIEWVRQYNKENFHINGENYEIVMMHYPMLSWDGSYRGSIQIHGHAHGSNDHLNVGTKRIDVGVDATNMFLKPISVQGIVALTSGGRNTDHHDL